MVDGKTIDLWLGLLEQSFIIHLLKPHHANFNKRLVKMPKLYFIDTGLACTLLGIRVKGQLNCHPLFGNLFENLVISDMLKTRHNMGFQGDLFFWRDNTGHEIDLIIERQDGIFPVEIQSGQTLLPDFFKGLNYWEKLNGNATGALIYGGGENQLRSKGIRIYSWKNIGSGIFG